ncbi:hypothetical protein AJ79_02626 [Helicocarpus griseus UAMH5409]|uniref:Uncharacterized protein n=1 Tax=Helicocarpus griseus UAMH5409 TaxID=1447875 RepID=A0A2B7Y1E6_9EURO|nr:hypothetical protein AJ79_02626 [Helicocarpus griseus UAMH5409]
MDVHRHRVVEAKSLQPLITLASNPPRYPRNPSKAPLEPLVLYIVRVPGKRDVFLSRLKPPTESSVSPELINAALYYIHVATPEDEAVLQTIEQEQRLNKQIQNQNSSSFAELNRVRRKPVPGADTGNNATDPTSTEPKPPPIPPRRPVTSSLDISPHPATVGRGREDYAQTSASPRTPEIQQPEESPALPPRPRQIHSPSRRPLPPIPADPGKHLFPSATSPNDANRRWSATPVSPSEIQESLAPPSDTQARSRASWDGGRPSLIRPERPSNQSFESLLGPQHISRDQRHSTTFSIPGPGRRSNDSKSNRSLNPFHLTLIRRDTTNNCQWNVGTMTNCNPGSSTEVAADGTIAIEILTPGYKKLAGERNPAFATNNNNSSEPLKFTRNLTLTYPPNDRMGPGYSQIYTPLTNSYHHSHSSSDRCAREDTSPPPAPRPRKGGQYTFASPWDGTCSFVPGINGRSLKCRHTIPTHIPSLAGLNLPNSSSSGGDNQHLNMQQLQAALESSPAATGTSPTTSSSSAQGGGSTVTAAELRFNLPIFSSPHYYNNHKAHHNNNNSNNNSNNDSYGGGDRPSSSSSNSLHATTTNESTASNSHYSHSHPHGHGHLHGHGHGLHNTATALRTHAQSLAGRLDLSLGRERAGGGPWGKSAKLGKLVVEDEGLKMLDLVVAACMGVWWGVYDGLC